MLLMAEAENWMFSETADSLPLEEKSFGMIDAAQPVLYQGKCSEYTGLFLLARGNCEGFFIGWKQAHNQKLEYLQKELWVLFQMIWQ